MKLFSEDSIAKKTMLSSGSNTGKPFDKTLSNAENMFHHEGLFNKAYRDTFLSRQKADRIT
jgi:hypothetical protein